MGAFTKNLAPTVDPTFRGNMFSGNHIWLNDTDQSVDLDTNTHNTYYDVATKSFVTDDTFSGTMTTSFSHYFTHDQALTQADLDALNANPNRIVDVWFNGATLPSGFSKANMVDYAPSSEGLVAGAAITNLKDNSTVQIANYTDPVRTTLKNQNYGVQSLRTIQDASGRLTGVVPANELNHINTDGYVDTGLKPSLPTYTIEEVIDNESRVLICDTVEAAPLTWEWETTIVDEVMEVPVIATNVYDFTIDWGDGSVIETYTGDGSVKPSHTYATAGLYTLVLSGDIPMIHTSSSGVETKIKRVLGMGETGFNLLYNSFRGLTNCTEFIVGHTDVSLVTNMYYTFHNMLSITTPPDVSNWDTSKVTSIDGMFRNLKTTTPPDVSNWDTSSIRTIGAPFYDMTEATTPPDVSNWDTSSATNMFATFYSMSSVTTPPDVSLWNTALVTDMRYFCYRLVAIPEIGDCGIELFNISSLIDATNFALGSKFATATMDKILVNWQGQPHQPNVTVDFGTGNYTLAVSGAAYDALVADGWVITGITGV